MLPYRYDRADAAQAISANNDAAQSMLSFIRDGRWWRAAYEEIALDRIADRQPYDADKYEAVWDAMRASHPLPCVRLAELGDGVLHIVDGVHRVAVARDRGFTHVPAIVLRERVDRPPPVPRGLLLDALNEIEAHVLAEAISTQLPDAQVEAMGHTEYGYSIMMKQPNQVGFEAHVERGNATPGDGPRAAWLRHETRELAVAGGSFEDLVWEIRRSLPALGVEPWTMYASHLASALLDLTVQSYVRRLKLAVGGDEFEDDEDEMGGREEGHELSYDENGQQRWGRRAAGLLIRREDGRVFLVFRSSDVYDPDCWGIPGGRVEPGETEWDGALSETKEELGGLPPVTRTGESTYRSGSFAYTTFTVTMSDAAAERWTPRLNWENTDWGWFDPAQPPQPLHPGVAPLLS